VENAFPVESACVPFFPVVEMEDENADVHSTRLLVWVVSLDAHNIRFLVLVVSLDVRNVHFLVLVVFLDVS
jgi:hypothetical protein